MARFLLSRRKVLEQYSIVKGCTDYVSYSFKTNPEVGQVLESSTDCFFSISARAHLERIADKGRVIFFAQGWSESEISELLDAGVKRFTVDNIQDLETLKRFMKGKNVKVWLFLRMKLKENTIHTGKYFVFGMGAEEIKSAIRDLADACWIERLGLHFHRKTQNTSEWSLKEEIVESLGEEVLGRISIVNMGGGLPSIYKNSRPEIESIMKRISEFAKWLRSRGIQLIIEPGRFIAAPAVKLEAEVKSVYEGNIIVDCSVYNCAMDTFIMNTRLLVEGELEEGLGRRYLIKGCTPDSIDIFRYNVWLREVKPGDKIVFINAGAYNFYSDFDGLEKIKTEVVD